jgi:hypothetical protein
MNTCCLHPTPFPSASNKARNRLIQRFRLIVSPVHAGDACLLSPIRSTASKAPKKRESGSNPIGITLDTNLRDLPIEVVFLNNTPVIWEKWIESLKLRKIGEKQLAVIVGSWDE